VKRSVPRSARGESRVTRQSGIHEARVLVVENVLGGRSWFGRISRRAIAVSCKASRGARPSRKEAAIRWRDRRWAKGETVRELYANSFTWRSARQRLLTKVGSVRIRRKAFWIDGRASLTGRKDGSPGEVGQPSRTGPRRRKTMPTAPSARARQSTESQLPIGWSRATGGAYVATWNVRGRYDSGEGSSSRNRRGGSASEAPPRAGQLLESGTPHAPTSMTAAAMWRVDAPETSRPKQALANSNARTPSSCRRETRGAHGDHPHATRMRGETGVTTVIARFMFEKPERAFDWGARRLPWTMW